MLYVIVFLGGAVAAAAGIGIWYFATFQQLLRRQQEYARLHARLMDASEAQNRTAFELQTREQALQSEIAAFESRRVQYADLLRENAGLKQDNFNLAVEIRKMARDHVAIGQHQEEIEQKVNELAQRYLKESVSSVSSKLSASNFASSKTRLLNVVEWCRGVGFEISDDYVNEIIHDLRGNFERLVREQFQREEQARIRAQIREEEKIAREAEKYIREAEREEAAIRAALEKALAEAKDQHSAEVEQLRAKLKEAEEKAARAISQAQMTKAGYVYVLSNWGSFGDNVFKIGMTRRLEPMDRVKELGDASVPFPFDVHMMISCENAPALENALHRELHRQRVNRVNFRKEYFRADFDTIRQIVEKVHGQVDFIAEPEAVEYRESLNMSEEDYDFIEQTMESLSPTGEMGED